MAYKYSLLGAAALFGLAMVGAAQSAQASALDKTGVCPAVGFASDCNLLIHFKSDGSITTTGPGGNYDGSEDALVGVWNESGKKLSSFGISGNFIFGFDGDGLCAYISCPANPNDTSGYAGPGNYFTIIDVNTGIVNFVGGLADGATSFFSLEEAIDISRPPIITTGVPEPLTLAVFGGGLVGAAALRRRKKKTA